MAYERGIEDPAKHSQALQIATLDMRVDVVGAIADVTVTVKFSNPGDETWKDASRSISRPAPW